MEVNMMTRSRLLLALSVCLIIPLLSLSIVAAQDGPMTEVGTPRTQTLIVDQLDGRIGNPYQMHPYQVGTNFNSGLHQLVYSNMWDINTISGEQFPALAAEMPEPLNDEFTHFRITLREGLHWSDGVELTTADVGYTIDVILNTPEFPYSGFLSQVVDSYEIIDDHTMELRTKRPEPRLSQTLGSVVWGNAFRVVPKHIWENEDPTTFDFFPPVSSGPYVVREVDPQGMWFLYEKREDWDRTDVGMLVGEPGPQYILFRFYGPEERRIIAGVQHNLDVFTDITPESWDILRELNPYARAWLENFPYANLDDPCQRGIAFVNQNPPYDQAEVRWALALATDIDSVSMSTFAGMLRVSALAVPPIAVLQETYHKPMRDWLIDFELEDGYQPFDPDFAVRIAERLRGEGIEGIPESEDELIDLFGVGWWRYDPDKAAELLESVGFSRDASSNWRLPDGSPWQITINAPAAFEVQSGRLAFAVADTWRNFGIDASVQQMESGTFWSSWSSGTFDAGSYWPGCGVMPDVYTQMNSTWNQRLVVPVGQPAPGNNVRHDSDILTSYLDEIAALTTDDPRTVELTTEFMKAWVEEMPWLPMFGTSKFVPVDTYYWDGLPTDENAYEGPWWWWSLFKYITPQIQPSGRS
jgi:peptide/nickel transport system substrate-binding protein